MNIILLIFLIYLNLCMLVYSVYFQTTVPTGGSGPAWLLHVFCSLQAGPAPEDLVTSAKVGI